MDFSDDQTERLITTVQTFSNLYDASSKEYKDKHIAQQSWMRIAEIMERDWMECKDKWRRLRDIYMKYRKAAQKPSGSGAGREVSWKFFKVMDFLKTPIRGARLGGHPVHFFFYCGSHLIFSCRLAVACRVSSSVSF